MEELEIVLEGEKLVLDPLKAIYWVQQKTLILSDVHLGKAGHFRKHGIPVPATVHGHDLIRLEQLIKRYSPCSIYFLGDLFHSEHNLEWENFVQWSSHFRHIRMTLVRGNHDILPAQAYESSLLTLVDELLQPPFHFTHEKRHSAHYNISGHIHPSIRLSGKARQGVTLPCFYFGERAGLVPAFGKFTGTYKIRPLRGDKVFAVAGDKIIELVA